MEGVVYHASRTRGIKELDPEQSVHEKSHGEKFLYASTSKELSMILSTRMTDTYSFISGKGTQESPAIVVERKKGIFDKFLHKPTNIYTLDAKDFYQGTPWQGEVTTTKKATVLKEEHIEDVYSALQSSIESGLVKLYHYPDRPPEIPKDNSDLIENRMIPLLRKSGSYSLVGSLMAAYPKLIPKILKSLIKNMFSRKDEIKKLPEGISEDKKEKEDTPHQKFVKELTKSIYVGPVKRETEKTCDKQKYKGIEAGREH